MVVWYIFPHSDICTKKNLATLLQENIYTIPNFLCVGRIASAPLLAHLICQAQNYPGALTLFAVAGATDLVP
jgi:cardiolipin synthase